MPRDDYEQRELEVIRAIYRENHGTSEERMNAIKERCRHAGYPTNNGERKAS